jgi:hypothetical protein
MKQTIEFAASLLVLSGWVLLFVRLFCRREKGAEPCLPGRNAPAS